jgi:two-component system, sensor histidine kinase and response regulator
MVIRRGNTRSLMATSLDGIIAGLSIAALSGAFLFGAVAKTTGDSGLGTATNMAYPIGDLLLLALAIGGVAILPKSYRRSLTIASVALIANAVGDTFNLLQPNSRVGYVTNSAAWPVSIMMFAVAAWCQPSDAWVPPPASAGIVNREKTAGLAFPALGALASIIVLFSFSLSDSHVGKIAVDLATAALLVAAVRVALTVRDSQALASARFRSLIDNSWDLIVVTEADFTLAYLTPSVQRVLGYSPHELIGTSITDVVHPDDAATVNDRLCQLGAGHTETAFETRVRRRNGEWRTIAWTATNLLADPAVRGYVLNGGDVTEARHAAEDLATARDEAVTASKVKSEFLATMSHEIRTPMNAVIGLTELLLETGLDSDQRELATGVSVSAENLLRIINDILDFSKIEAGKIEVEEVELNIPGIADDVGRIVAESAHSKGLELLVDVHPDVPLSLLGDPVRVQQVLLNLASNAVKFTADGEVVIRVTLAGQKGDRAALRFEVIDMGIGIAPADQLRLFSAFAQADSSTTRKFGGTGLGLAICRQLVDLMGGTLGVISSPGEGSTFWFELSLRLAEAIESSAPTELRTLVGRRALVVDDNATNRMILRQQLLSWGVETVEAVDAFDGLAAAVLAAQEGQPFDLGVLDLNMPGMDGLELASALKADPSTAPMVLFLLSSSGQRLSAAESHVRGLAGNLTKPVRQSELFDCLITGLNDDSPLSEPHKAETAAPENSEVKGMILLVEDNKMNQLVASKMLAKLGFSFDIANHGGEAVAALAANSYDAVLMDCQMPEMDGYEATAEIRRIEGGDRHTPIIAMTAAAMAGDRERCLAAGMDDYISKPVRPEAIDAVLARWIRPAPLSTDAAPSAGTLHAEPEVIDRSQLEVLRSLDDGEGAVLAEIIEEYLTQTAAGRDELVRVLAEGDPGGLERAAHALKGASANVGAARLADLCAQMEARGRFAQLDGAAELVGSFDAEFRLVRDALTSALTTT